jgi:hypothetical protein
VRFHLAQANIARMRGTPNDPIMAGLVARIDEMNQLAEQSPGFVWRLKGSEATPDALRVFADYFLPFDADRLFYNMSVWESVEALKNYVFKTQHADMLKDKDQWTQYFDRAHLAMWWVPAGHVPAISESAERLRSLHEKGPTDFAFTFRNLFPQPNHT